MTSTQNREEVKNILTALLITRKEATQGGVSLPQLDQDYRDQEGTRIPFRKCGYSNLVDFILSLSSSLCLTNRNGTYYVSPIITEEVKHVSNLVAHQNSKRNTRGGRRPFKTSPYYPRVPLPFVAVTNEILAEIVGWVKKNPGGVRISDALAYASGRLCYNIPMNDFALQLRDLSHEIIVDVNMLYSVSDYKRRCENMYSTARASVDRAKVDDPPREQKVSNSRPAGLSDDETQSDFAESFYIPDESNKESKEENHITNESKDVKEEDASVLINERTRFRLEKLIQNHPDGIWCADLPGLYQQEYSIPLNYKELGFGSVSVYASHLPEIFHCIRPQEHGDFKLYNAKAPEPVVKHSERPKAMTLASLHNIYEQYIEPTEAVPAVLSKQSAQKLIPEGVMTAGETVGHICVTEFRCGIHEYVNVVVCDVFTPTFFWIQLLSRIPKFNEFMATLHAFYDTHAKSYKMPPAVMEVGMNIACLYDDKWHRGAIEKIRPDDTVTVIFYDYGTVKNYPKSEIHFLHRSFSNLPAQAIACGLVNIKPLTGNKWTHEISVEFVLKAMQVPLVATIASIDTNNNTMMVALTNTEGKEDFYINDWMVQSGYAVFGKMRTTVDLSERADPVVVPRRGRELLSPIIEQDCEDPLYANSTLNGDFIGLDCELLQYVFKRTTERCKFELESRGNDFIPSSAVMKDIEELAKYLIDYLRRKKTQILDKCDNVLASEVEETLPENETTLEGDSQIENEVEVDAKSVKFDTIPEEEEEAIVPDVESELMQEQDAPTQNINTETLDSSSVDSQESFASAKSSRNGFTSSPINGHDKRFFDRQKFENSLTKSTKSFFARVKDSFATVIEQFDDTNPFKKDVINALYSQGNRVKELSESPVSAPQSRIVYESPPVMYNTEHERFWKENGTECSTELAGESEAPWCDEKKKNVEMWITNTNDCELRAVPSSTLTSEEWLDSLEESVRFKRPETPSKTQTTKTTIDDNDNYYKVAGGIQDDSGFHETARRENASNTLLTNEIPHAEAVQLTNSKVYLISNKYGGWVAVEEFGAVFMNKSLDETLNILESKKVSYLRIYRSDHSALFHQLDRFAVRRQRDRNNIFNDVLHLISLKQCLKILQKSKMVTINEINDAAYHKIFPKGSSLLQDLYKLINTLKFGRAIL